jgi:hypothetical protein
MVGVDVLYVERIEQHPLPCGGIDPLVEERVLAGEGYQDRGSVGDEQRIWRDDGLQHERYGLSVEYRKDEVSGGTVSVPGHHDGHLLGGSSGFLGFAASFSRVSFQLPISLLGIQEQRLINFDKSLQDRWFQQVDHSQKAVPPSERDGLADTTFFGGSPNRQPIEEASCILKPFLPMEQPGQRG